MNDLVCRDGVDYLMDYLEGTLPADTRAAIDTHVSGCPKCVAFIASYQATPRIVREATKIEMPEDLQASLLAFLRARRAV
jgi:anti-sigma factor RsiW